MRAADHTTEISSPEMWVFVSQDVGLHIAESRVWFVFNPVIKSLDDILFETGRARIGCDYGIALRICEFVIGDAENVHFDPSGNERDNRVHMHRNAKRGVQCDCGPHHVDIILGDTVGLQEVARSVRAVNLEALVRLLC
jgi:hypothetical protein